MPRRTHKKLSESDMMKAEESLEKSADKHHFTGKKRNAYIYGAKRAMGWKPKRER